MQHLRLLMQNLRLILSTIFSIRISCGGAKHSQGKSLCENCPANVSSTSKTVMSMYPTAFVLWQARAELWMRKINIVPAQFTQYSERQHAEASWRPLTPGY